MDPFVFNANMTSTLENDSFTIENDSSVPIAAEDEDGNCAVNLDFTNTSDDEIVARMFYTEYVRLLMTYILPSILVIGLIGNVSFFFTLTRVPKMRTLTNAYLAALSLTDICFILIIGSRYIWTIIKSPLVFSNPFRTGIGCALFSSAANFLFFESNLLVTLISYERYFAICHSLKHRACNTTKRTARQIAATVIIALFLSLTLTPKVSEMRLFCVSWPERKPYIQLPTILYYCKTSQPIFENYPPILQGVCFIITLCANVFFYGKIIQQLLQQTKAMAMAQDKQMKFQLRRQQTNRQVTIMLAFNATVFCLCLLPYQFFLLQNVVERLSNGKLDLLDASSSSLLFWIGTSLNTVNSSINPLIYNGVNSRYRRALLHACRCRKDDEFSSWR